MSEAAFRVLQLGQQGSFGGTAWPATVIYPCDPGSGEFELDRAIESPDEDYGVAVRHQASRGSNGVRVATGNLSSTARFEDLEHILEMTLGTAVRTGAGTYTHTWTGDAASTTVLPYTVEVGEETQDWAVPSVVCEQFDLGFDALTVPGNSMWTVNATLKGVDKKKATATGSLSAPSVLETMEGHLSQLYEGPVGTAFASLSELAAHLVQYRVTVADPKPFRVYGDDADDIASAMGRGKRETSFEALLKISASSVANVFDIFNVSGGLPTDRRWRVKVTGVAPKTMTIDGRVRFTSVNVDPDGRDGERLLSVAGYYVYDSTLASDIQAIIVNTTA